MQWTADTMRRLIGLLLVACALLIVPLSASAQALDRAVTAETWVPKPSATQTIYQIGVPHTDKNGNFRLNYDPALSFLPIGHYWAWVGTAFGQVWSFGGFAAAGFNCCMMRYSPSTAQADAAQNAGIQMIVTDPPDARVNLLKNHPSMLAWRLYNEPTGVYWGGDMQGIYDTFVYRRGRIKALDPVHPVYTLDDAHITEPTTSWWTTWNTAGDVTSHDNYPFNASTTSISGPRGIPESVSLAVAANNQTKPMWFCAQAFWSVGFEMPTPAQERCMIYTSIIHGAAGVIYCLFDTFMARQAGRIGIAPNPKADYGYGIVAAADQLAKSSQLWNAVVSINTEMAALRPAILSPTSTAPYEVYVSNTLPSVTENPIRTLLKTDPAGGMILLLANVDGVPQKVKVRFPNKSFAATELYGSLGFTKTGDYIELTCPAWDARVIRILDLQAMASGVWE